MYEEVNLVDSEEQNNMVDMYQKLSVFHVLSKKIWALFEKPQDLSA